MRGFFGCVFTGINKVWNIVQDTYSEEYSLKKLIK